MSSATSPLLDELRAHARRLRAKRLEALFADPERAGAWTIEAAGLYFDHSKQFLDAAARDALLALAQARELPARIKGQLY